MYHNTPKEKAMQKHSKNIFLTFAVVLAALLGACGGGGGGGGGAGTPGTPTGGGTINGLVTDFATGARLAGVSVTGGGKSVTTDSNGAFTLSGFASGVTVAVTMDKSGYALGHGNAEIGVNAAPMVLPLKKEGSKQAYNKTSTKTIYQTTEAGPYAVIFSPNTLNTADTNLTVSVTPLDPTKESSVLPGNLATTGAILTPLTFAEFSVFDSSGNRVNLVSGQEAIVEMPIPPDLRAKAEYQIDLVTPKIVHCYSYNSVTGQWEDFVVGTVVKSSVDGTTPVLRASIKHFSWYGGAPEGTDCYDVYGKVISAVDGKPLPYARVEAFPGTATTSDANGNFVVTTTAGGPNSFTASRTFIDTNGSVSGMAGAKVIEFGKVDGGDLLQGLVKVPCTSVVPPTPPTPTTPPKVTIKIGGVGLLSYQVEAFLVNGVVEVLLNETLPDGSAGAEAAGALIELTGPGGAVKLSEQSAGVYIAYGFTYTPGARYTLTIDADHNGSVDGSGSVIAVGNLAWVTPLDGGTYAASSFQAQWSDSASAVAGYSVTYFASIVNSGASAYAYYTGSNTSFNPVDLANSSMSLPAGSYTASLYGFSGSFNPGGNWDQTNNISGSTVSGTFYSIGVNPTPVTFTLN